MLKHNIKNYFKIFTVTIISIILLFIIFLSHYVLVEIKNHFSYRYKSEIEFSNNFWNTIINNNSPPDNFSNYFIEDISDESDEYFYFFKVWFYDYSYNLPNTNLLKLKYAGISESHKKGDKTIFTIFIYGKDKHSLYTTITKKNKEFKLHPTLSLSYCLWRPDKNKDGIIDINDVILSKKERTKSK